MNRTFISICLFSAVCTSAAAQRRDSSFVSPTVDTLKAAVVQTGRAKRSARSQTSLTVLDKTLLNKACFTLGSPDLLKTLQLMPGVASGSELMNGLYVRGGDGHDNLFLLDGIPLYQVGHLLGLFSTFNLDIIDDAGFYKGGFPARYGGRLSSVVDVSVRDGNYEKWKGQIAIGLIDGRLQIEGPIVKNKLSLNFSARRTWIDFLKILATPFAADEQSKRTIKGTGYNFYDINLKLTQKIQAGSKLSFSFYNGRDAGKMINLENIDETNFSLNWGNSLCGLKWEKDIIGDDLFLDTDIFYTKYNSDIIIDGFQHLDEENIFKVNEKNKGFNNDYGTTINLYCNLIRFNKIRLGGNYTHHYYNPFRDKTIDGINNSVNLKFNSEEVSIYAEDEVNIGSIASINAGLRYSSYYVEGQEYHYWEPRISARADVSDKLLLKASFSRTSQFSHQIASCNIDFPTNIWMPSTEKIKPMLATQYVAGLKWTMNLNLSVDIELWHKNLNYLYEYTGVNSFLPPINQWEQAFAEGKGRASGVDIGIEYKNNSIFATVYYTLSSSERFFPAIYYDWYADKNDNRHKLNLHCQYKFNRDFDMSASWIIHSGDRFSEASSIAWIYNGVYSTVVYGKPNLYKLPAYHRLDIGFNWHKQLRNKQSRTINLSIYNAYCHLNAVSAHIERKNNKIQAIAQGLIPIIPTVNYIYKF